MSGDYARRLEEAVAAERRRFVTFVRATCACQRCKDDIAALLGDFCPVHRTDPGAERLARDDRKDEP